MVNVTCTVVLKNCFNKTLKKIQLVTLIEQSLAATWYCSNIAVNHFDYHLKDQWIIR